MGLTCATGRIVGIEWIGGGSGALLEGVTGLFVEGGRGAVKGLLVRAVLGEPDSAGILSSYLFWFVRGSDTDLSLNIGCAIKYSQLPLIRTLKGKINLVELSNVRINEYSN